VAVPAWALGAAAVLALVLFSGLAYRLGRARTVAHPAPPAAEHRSAGADEDGGEGARAFGDHSAANLARYPRDTVVGHIQTKVYHIVGVTKSRLPSRKNSRVFRDAAEAQAAGFRRARW
jgi:hypothetical protein